jgi:hypothetical protein
MDEITTHMINVTLPSLANLTELQKEFDALELPQAARDALLRSVVTEQNSSPVCDPPVCDPPVCDPPVCDPPEMEVVVEPVVTVVEPVVTPVVTPEPLVPQVEISSHTSVWCCCQ